MEKILVTGALGQLGSEIKLLSSHYPQFEWVFVDREEMPLDDLEGIEKSLEIIKPTVIFSCAAYTAVDRAESEPEVAKIVNELSVAVIAKYAKANQVKMIHISTDYVFDGNSSTPLKEEAPTSPINVYGETKLGGELACLQFNPETIIIRTAWVYSKFGNNFVKTMQRLMQERESISVVNDQVGSPTYAADLAKAMIDILVSGKWISGIYHFSNEGEINWYQFALAIKELGGYTCEVKGIPASNYPTPAKRPNYSLLDKTKIKETYGVEVPFYKDSLKRYFN
jgi:dTDP-4-dehydrorhamnose reductase